MKESIIPKFSKRMEGVSESSILKLNSTVTSMKNQGIDVINLTVGEPDFWVPQAAKDAVIESVHLNRSKYTPVPGVTEFRDAIALKTNLQQPVLTQLHSWSGSNVIVTNGAKQALFNTFMAILDPGDEVLLPAPYWVSYPEMIKITGGISKIITTSYDHGFKLQPKQLKASLGLKVKALILNSPCNPTGAVYSAKEFRALAEVLIQSPGAEKLWIISDEIYDRIILGDDQFCSFLNAAPELRNRTVTINGVSKSAAMTGWRIGWSVASEPITQVMLTLQGQSTSGVNSLAQWAGLAALRLSEGHFSNQIESYRHRRDLMLEKLKKASKMEVVIPEGAFYIFVGVKRYLREGEDSIAFAQRLLEEAKVAVVPGVPFGQPDYLRLSFSTDEMSIQEGCERLVNYIK
jgi:aspartate aminotransferase